MRRNAALLAGVAAGTVAAVAFRRRRVGGPEPAGAARPDPRADELRRKLAQARDEAADEDDFEAAGMAGEAMVEDEPRPAPGAEGEVDDSRRRVHEDARAAAEEMRRTGGPNQ